MDCRLKEILRRLRCLAPAEDATGILALAKTCLGRKPRLNLIAFGLALGTLFLSGASLSASDLSLPVHITEIMYNPVGGDAYEYIELQNTGDLPVDLSGMVFDGLSFTFPANSVLAPKAIMVLSSDANPSAFKARHPGVAVAGTYGGRLANGGERIALQISTGVTVTSVTYGDSGFWPSAADGGGYSLEILDLEEDANDPANWRASLAQDGTPGQRIPVSQLPRLRINEIAAQTASVGGPTTEPPSDWIELLNSGSDTVNLIGWSITDDGNAPRKYVFPAGVSIGSGTFLLVWCDSQFDILGLHTGFNLKTEGETLFLFDGLGNRVDGVSFGPQVRGSSLGRVGNSWGLTQPTPGQANLPAGLAPQTSLVINEWLASSGAGQEDWIELYNRDTKLPVALRGLFLQCGPPAAADAVPTGNASFQVKSHSFVEPGGFLRLWADEKPGADHLDFKLSAAGGFIALYDSSETEVDRVVYGPQSENLSQGRLPDGSANIAFFPSAATPGTSNVTDKDNDGIPDYWELAFGLNPGDASDASKDADGDGVSNVQEYLSGTEPRNSDSALRLHAELTSAKSVRLSFQAVAGRSYSILSRSDVKSGPWTVLANIDPQSASRRVEISDPSLVSAAARLYRLVTPAAYPPDHPVITSMSPGENATNVSMRPAIEVRFREALNPTTVTTDTFRITDDLVQPVKGRFRFRENFTVLAFEPDLPLHQKTTYTVVLSDGMQNLAGETLKVAREWSFATAAAPDLEENRSVYQQDSLAVLEARVKIFEKPGGYTFQDVLNDTDPSDEIKPTVDVLFQEGSFGAGLTHANATLALNGQTSRHTRQKSFTIKLYSQSAFWRGHRTIVLKKHPYDLTRVRNKLSFDLFKDIPHFTSLRTSFVNLFVNGEDLGLFTQIEEPAPMFLESHGLDRNGQLYKATEFEFFRYPEQLRTQDDPLYSETEFESILEIKGGPDHAELLTMLDEVNNLDLDINTVIAKHFNRNNYLTWFAVNILTQNHDTTSQNFFLYSPSDSSCWYLLPWDYDGAWDFFGQPIQVVYNTLPRWRQSVANWWAAVLHRRFLRDPNNLADLNARIERLRSTALTPDQISTLLSRYHDVVESFISRLPDLAGLDTLSDEKVVEFNAEYQRVAGRVVASHTNYYETLERPMPVFLDDARLVEGGRRFRWDASFDLQGDALTYDLQISRTPLFNAGDIVFQKLGLTVTRMIVPDPLPRGQYYWRVIIRDSKNPLVNWQLPFDHYYDVAADEDYDGMKVFTVE